MRLVAISDTHQAHEYLDMPAGDVLIHAGDWTHRGREPEVCSFFNWFLRQDYWHKILICGNHDIDCHLKARDVLRGHSNITFLHDTALTLNGIKFYGSPWTPAFYNWGYMTFFDKEREEIWGKIPIDTDVLITHGPPYRIFDRNVEGGACGDRQLFEAVMRVKPKVHIFGHIHESRDHAEIEGTRMYNVCSLDETYKIIRQPVVIDI